MRNKIISSCVIFFIFLVSSCTSSSTPAPTATTTVLPILAATETPLPPSTETPLPTATAIPEVALAKYTLNTTMDYDAHTLKVDESILYPNHTANQLDKIVLAVEPNLWTESFNLASIAIDGTAITTYSLEGQRLELTLPSLLKPGAELKINIQYKLDLPFADQQDPNISRPRIYGYTARQMNLTNWYPFIVPYINGEWVLHEPWVYGEHLVYDAADYEVNLKFADPATAPTVAASGFAEPQADSTRYTINAARTFALSASREFQVATTQVGDVTVSSYYFAISKVAGQAVLKASAEAIQVFSQTYGAYPHKTLSIVMADFKDSMEFSAFYYHSPLYYDQYNGAFNNYLISIGVHETAHQWWFEQVGNDQALQPWLDESLATYSERIYYENIHPDVLKEWWWAYRVDFFNPHGFIDIPIYDGQGFESYRVTVYLQGAHFLEDLRARIGDEAFFAFVQDYFAQGRGKIVTAADFFRILRTHTSTDYSDLVKKYFQNTYQ
jgi:hypothetical protein